MRKVVKLWGTVACLLLVYLVYAPMKAKAGNLMTITYSPANGDWEYSLNDGEKGYSSIADLEAEVQSTDTVLVDGNGVDVGMITLNLGNGVGEVAAVNGGKASITAPNVGVAYAVGNNSLLIVSSNVSRANAAPGGILQVNGNVSEVEMTYDNGQKINLGVTGSVGKINALLPSDSWNPTMVYNIQAGRFELDDDNVLTTEAQYYSLAPASGNAAATVWQTQSTTQQTESTAQAAGSGTANESAKSPKTGEKMSLAGAYLVGLFFLMVGVFVSGRRA